ncbi:uncharacterized protein F4807DRAFT_462874 [Annulohypoxylon truncatum]|uniref:uncharacterized protein n=1 Tax=Annulohypoxylon truncatum TaxID=327061 RepID=UPI0020087AF9|nr:uncharacterized protein F4807DRAFT_462874 [Annulohypoxylon truncatum]KAI1207142.1 hypothetical protein F4807DRAFT_462874 [Annulohypoxylon truncatum]
MTSLEFIMDMSDMSHEEDSTQIDKNEDGSIQPGPSKSQDPSRAATSSHAKPKDQDDRLTPAPTRRHGPSGRSSKSTATASSPSTSSARPASVSRRSTTSSESMDPGGYGGHAQSSSSGGGMPPSMPSRPMGNAPGEGSLPVKLTPITRRVSRAKKGVPVHTCDICKPPKTFTRAEHLRRHQLSHGNPRYPCTFPNCDKAFHRADLLARHAQRHDQDDKASRGTGEDASRPTSAEGPPGMSYMTHGSSSMGGVSGARQAMADPSDMSSGAAYTTSLSPYQSMSNQGSGSGQHTSRGESYQTSNPPSGGHSYVLSSIISNPPPSIGGSPVTGTPFEIGFTPRTSSPFPIYMDTTTGLSQNLPSLTIPDNSMPPGLVHHGHDGSPWPSSASESNYSTPSEISHRRNNMPRGYESPTSDWPGTGLYSGTSHSIHSPGGGIDIATTAPFFGTPFSPTAPALDQSMMPLSFSDDPSFVENPHQYNPYSSVRSPTPPTISLSAQPAENLVTLAAPSIPGAASTGRQKGTQLLGPLGGTTFLTANNLSPHVRNAIPRYIDLYWKRFDPLFPLVHRKSAKTAADEVLRCAMAAVGTQFLQSKEDRIRGNELHEFAWKEVKTCTQWNLQVMQAILLCELYSRFRGRSVSRSSSEPFQSLYSRDHLFSNFLSSPVGQWYPYSTSSSLQMADHQMPDGLLFSASTRHDRWNEWISNESRRRLLAACFVLDVHASVYYQQHLMKPFPMSTTPSIPLIRPTEDLWAAQSSESWEVLLESWSTNTEPTNLSGETTAEQVADAPYLDQTVFLASEALRLPKRPSPSILDLKAEVDETSTERITRLFPGSSVGNTYLALHFTPLHDLLAVSGETWLFTKKVATSQVFQQHKRRLQHWCNTLHAGVAVRFAAKALLAFVDCSNHNVLNATVISNLEEEEGRDGSWHMLDISDYWGMYVCALICWALGQRAMARGSTNAGSDLASSYHQHQHQHQHHNNHSNANSGEKGEREAVRWLKMVAELSSENALNVRGRKETMAIVSMVRRRLEDEAVGSKNRLLVDATRTLKNLEERGNHKWF